MYIRARYNSVEHDRKISSIIEVDCEVEINVCIVIVKNHFSRFCDGSWPSYYGIGCMQLKNVAILTLDQLSGYREVARIKSWPKFSLSFQLHMTDGSERMMK